MGSTPVTFTGYIEEIGADGRVAGWAARPGHVERLHVGIHAGDRLVADAVAHHYRPDLLAAGHALGHCGLLARLRVELEPGPCELELRLIGLDADPIRFSLTVPERRSGTPPPPRPSAGWTAADLLPHLSQLHLTAQLAAMGPDRFVDGACQFVLGRWADPPTLAAVRTEVADGRFDPTGFMRALLLSAESRNRTDERLPSPFDARFPFRFPPHAMHATVPATVHAPAGRPGKNG